jgi:NADPH-dependent glutamate synthase beta subunit-like oxidoreductase
MKMPLKPTTIRFTPDAMTMIQRAAKRQGCSVSQFVREAALMRASMSSDENPYPMRDLAAEMRRLGEEGAQLIEQARPVAQNETELNAARDDRLQSISSRP